MMAILIPAIGNTKLSRENFMKLLLIAAALSALCAPVWAVNKCKGPDGKVVYQDQPCDNAEKVNLGGAGQGDPNSQTATYWKREAARQAHDAQMETAIADRKMRVGMTAEEARLSWGSPTKINVSVGSYGKHEQWVYRRGSSGDQYVYLQNGVVTSMQSPE
jgi:hypothetical protein